jgi:hypothetical protein
MGNAVAFQNPMIPIAVGTCFFVVDPSFEIASAQINKKTKTTT